MTGYPPGVYSIPEDDYFADPALSCSGAKLLLPPSCPELFKWRQDHPGSGHKDVFDFGSAAHKMVLGAGPELDIIQADNWQTKASQQARDKARAEGKTPLLAADHAKVKAMAEAIRRHPIASALLDPERGGRAEQSLFWLDEETNVPRRARVDWLPEAGQGPYVIADFKTCERADLESLRRSIVNYGYHRQEQWYLDGVRALGLGADPDFLFIFQERNPPYLINVARIADEDRWLGAAENRMAIEIFRDCTETGDWPGYEAENFRREMDTIATIKLPPWAARTQGVYA